MADLSQTEDLLRRHAIALADAARLDVEYETKVASPEKTSELVNSVTSTEPTANGDIIVSELRADAPHAIFVVAGTRAHAIFPTQEHGLLVWPSGGGGVVFHHGPVWHPGTMPNVNFWSDPVLQERWTRALEDATRSVVTVG